MSLLNEDIITFNLIFLAFGANELWVTVMIIGYRTVAEVSFVLEFGSVYAVPIHF